MKQKSSDFARPYEGKSCSAANGAETEQKLNRQDLNEVVHPDHYMKSGIETFEEMILVFGVEAVKTYCKIVAWKYRARAPYKGAQEKDMAKAAWYLQKLQELERGE